MPRRCCVAGHRTGRGSAHAARSASRLTAGRGIGIALAVAGCGSGGASMSASAGPSGAELRSPWRGRRRSSTSRAARPAGDPVPSQTVAG
jgi:hypothetical protein